MSTRANQFRTCPVLVLVGGQGTRLRPAYPDGPKALAPIEGRPFLAYFLKLLADACLTRVVLCVGYRAAQIEQWLGDGSDLGLNVSYSREDKPLGTAGALGLAYSRYTRGERVLAMNGDSILQLSLAAMWELHLVERAEATVALAQVSDTSRYGSVDVNEKGWVTSFREKTSEQAAGYISAGVYLFEPSVMQRVVAENLVSVEREVLPVQLARGLLAFKSEGYFIDIGVPQDLMRAQSELGAVVGF
jgi:D-glycero-alpha-D-manno-heptose 1-phosphate guanylyltransferase